MLNRFFLIVSVVFLFGLSGCEYETGVDSGVSHCDSDHQVRINEAVSKNSMISDGMGDHSDWFELYNCHEADVELTGWTISDDIEDPEKWTFPKFTLPQSEYIRIWASDKDILEGEDFHTNFKISSSGETLYLFDDDGELVDSLLVEDVPNNYSVGVDHLGNSPVYFSEVTPGFENQRFGAQGTVNTAITFSNLGGEVGPIELMMSGAGVGQEIRYTLDSTEPSEDSQVYKSAISISKNTIVRARIYQLNMVPSAIQTHSYFVNKDHDLPIISLVTNPDNLFDSTDGIYAFGGVSKEEGEFPYFDANFWGDNEKPINVSFFENINGSNVNELALSFDAGMKIFGGWSRAYDQRSLAIFARSKYGYGKIKYPIFPDRTYEKFESLVLRNSGQDWSRTMLRDGFMTRLMDGSGVDTQAYRPTVTYVNGEYWGIYNIREKISEHFLAIKYDLRDDELDLVGSDGSVIHGSSDEYQDLIEYVEDSDLSGDSEYQYVASKIDVDNYIQYQMAEIYFNNTDWPGNNIKYWKPDGGKWRWILYDTDYGYSLGVGVDVPHHGEDEYLHNMLAFATSVENEEWSNPPWATLLLRKLLENDGFKLTFVNAFADAMNTRFSPKNSLALLDEMAAVIASEIYDHRARWADGYDFDGDWPDEGSWEGEIERMRRYALYRPDAMINHLMSEFKISGVYQLNLEMIDVTEGSVFINEIIVEQEDWSGRYFNGYPISISAIPADGYVFSHWSSAESENMNGNDSNVVVIDLESTLTLKPIFIPE